MICFPCFLRVRFVSIAVRFYEEITLKKLTTKNSLIFFIFFLFLCLWGLYDVMIVNEDAPFVANDLFAVDGSGRVVLPKNRKTKTNQHENADRVSTERKIISKSSPME